jgi:hypothetical protein
VTGDGFQLVKPLIENLKNAVKEHKLDEVEKAQKELEEKWTPIIQKVYQENAANGQQPGSNPFGAGPDFMKDMFNGQNMTQQQQPNNGSDFEEVK